MSVPKETSGSALRLRLVAYVGEAAFILVLSYVLLIVLRGKVPEGFANPGGTAASQSENTVPPIQARWPSLEAMLAEAPNVPLAEHEFEFRGIKYLIQLPRDAQFDVKAFESNYKAPLNSSATLQLHNGGYDMDERRRVMTMLSARPKPFPFGDDNTVLCEFEKTIPERYMAYINLTAGHRAFGFSVDNTVDDYKIDNSLADCLLMFKCARTLKLKEPDPTDPVEILKKYRTGIQTDPDQPERIVGLDFDHETTAALLPVAAKLSDVESISLPLNYLGGEMLEGLSKFSKLKALELESSVNSDVMLRNVFACQQLESLQFDLGSVSPAALEEIKKLTALKKLKIGQISAKHLAALPKIGGFARLEDLELGADT
jgi:hypothetical protein